MSLNKNYVNERRYIFAICTEKMVVMRPVYNRIERFKNSHHSRRGAQRDVANDVIGFQSECQSLTCLFLFKACTVILCHIFKIAVWSTCRKYVSIPILIVVGYYICSSAIPCRFFISARMINRPSFWRASRYDVAVNVRLSSSALIITQWITPDGKPLI